MTDPHRAGFTEAEWAAARPRIPALALWVWTTSGW